MRGLRAGTPCPLALQRNTSAGLGAASGLAGNGSRDKAQPRGWLCPQPLRAREEGRALSAWSSPEFQRSRPCHGRWVLLSRLPRSCGMLREEGSSLQPKQGGGRRWDNTGRHQRGHSGTPGTAQPRGNAGRQFWAAGSEGRNSWRRKDLSALSNSPQTSIPPARSSHENPQETKKKRREAALQGAVHVVTREHLEET